MEPLYPWERTGSLDVEQLLTWVYVDQRYDRSPVAGLYALEAAALGYEPRGQSSDGVARVAEIAAVGCRIDIFGPGRCDAHPVCAAVDAAVHGHDEAALLLAWAKAGARPGGWAPPPRWFVPERWEVEGVEAMWVYRERRTGAHCPIIAVASGETMAFARARYLRWWDALDDVAWTLAARALPFAVLPPACPREPWSAGPASEGA